MSSREEIIFIPFLLPSQNAWITKHHHERNKIKKQNTSTIMSIIKKQDIEPFKGKVILEFQPYVGKTTSKKKGAKSTRKFDIENYSPSRKFFEDCIVRSDIIEDDSGEYVIGHYSNEVIVDRNIWGDGMIIKIIEVPDDYMAEKHNEYYEKVLNHLSRVN